jgi:uncharacterized Fe-S cluster-containing protein
MSAKLAVKIVVTKQGFKTIKVNEFVVAVTDGYCFNFTLSVTPQVSTCRQSLEVIERTQFS